MTATGMHTRPNDALRALWTDRLVQFGFAASGEGLRAAARASQPDAREIAFALLGLEGDRAALELVRAGLADEYPPARVEAARAAVLLGEERGRGVLRDLLDCDWPETAVNAAAYLADLGDAAGYGTLADAAASEVEALRVQAVLQARAFLPHASEGIDVVGLLRRAALADPSALVRREAVYQVARLEEAPRREILQLASGDPDPAVAKAARLRVEGPVT
jgi:HEAT repeat protein